MRLRARRNRRNQVVAELNITAFMNLMVILVPFLLITAVFTKISILELHLPASSNSEQVDKEPTLELEVVVLPGSLEVQDRNKGHLRSFPNRDDGYDTATLGEYLQAVKFKYPEVANATILLAPDIDYETLVQVMDSVRSSALPEQHDGELMQAELFPDISIGDAPINYLQPSS